MSENIVTATEVSNYKKRRRKILVVVSLMVIAALFALFIYGYGEYIEIKELGDEYLDVFIKDFTVKAVSGIISFILVFAIFYFTTKTVVKISRGIRGAAISYLEKRFVPLVISFAVSFAAVFFISDNIHQNFLLFANRVDFGITDPIFGHDIGYYVFTRPFVSALIDSIVNVWLIATLYCIVLYVLVYYVSEEFQLGDLLSDKKAIFHNIINIVIFFVLKACTYRFVSEEILYSSITGDATGAGYTDINIWLNFYRVLPFLLLALVGLAIFFCYKGKYKAVLASIAVYPVSFLIVYGVAFCVQTFEVKPNESVKEAPFLQHNITYTKMAYNIADVTETEFAADNMLTSEDIVEYQNVLSNVRITDYASTVTAYNSLQGLRNFYKFNSADVAKYNIDGKNTLTMVSARELNLDGLGDGAENYTNSHYRYTHGFGVVMSPLNRVTKEGQPEFLINNIPPQSRENVPVINQPRIYYGEIDNDAYSITNSSINEIDYIEGSTAKEYSYTGDGGIKMSTLNRLVFSLKNADFQMLISDYIKPDSRLIINRNVVERVRLAMPFLTFDSDPYLVVDKDGGLKWIVDGYTTSEYFPYAQKHNDINYIRNSVKVVVDAYNGSITAYIIDKNDPVIQVYSKIYPTVFDNGEIPEDIRAHIVYPEYIFKLQAQVYGKYHINDSNTLYNKSDSWVFAKEKYGSEIKDIEPYYNMLKIDEMPLTDENFVIMIPYTLQGKENMQAWLAASCDFENYGQMVAYQFPKGKNVYGTQQIESRIDNDAKISEKMTLWNQNGSSVIRGNTLMVPVKSSIIYIEPLYITAAGSEGAIPELRQVIVCYADKIVMEDTLEKALESIFDIDLTQLEQGEDAGEKPIVDSGDNATPSEDKKPLEPDINDVIKGVIDAYDNAMNSNKSGDWEDYGKNMNILEQEIDKLRKYR